jgi:hypothetical protein
MHGGHLVLFVVTVISSKGCLLDGTDIYDVLASFRSERYGDVCSREILAPTLSSAATRRVSRFDISFVLIVRDIVN